MAIIKVQSEGINLADDFTFTGELSGHNYPAFHVILTADQSITDNTVTKVQFNSALIDTDSAFDTSTNYRFTVPTGKGGKYKLESMILGQGGGSNANRVFTYLYKNGDSRATSLMDYRSNPGNQETRPLNIILDLDAGDYIEMYMMIDTNNSAAGTIRGDGGANAYETWFQGFRIGS